MTFKYSNDPWDFNYVGGSNSYQDTAPPAMTQPGNFANLGGGSNQFADLSRSVGSQSQFDNLGNNPAFQSTWTPGTPDVQEPQPSFMDKYFGPEGSQQRVDNYWRAGAAGLGALGLVGGIYDANKRRKQAEAAASRLESLQDPNQAFYRARLAQLFQNRGNYTQDPQSAARSGAIREAIDRQNAAQGRTGYTAAQQQAMNDAAAYAQNNEIQNLLKVVGAGDDLAINAANLRANVPTYNPAAAVPHLQSIFRTGQDYTRAMGFSSANPMLSPRQQQVVQRYPNFAPE